MGGINLPPPHNIDRKIGEGVVGSGGRGGRRPCCPHLLNLTLVQYICRHGSLLISYDKRHPPPFIMSPIPGPIQSIHMSLIPNMGFVCLASSAFVS